VAAILARHGVPLIEDDIFAPLLDKPIRPISSLIPDQSFYIASLSKALAPALRVAFLKMPDRYYQDALDGLRLTTWLPSPLLVDLAGRLIATGAADALIKEQKKEIGQRQGAAKEILGRAFKTGHPASLHLWLKLPEPWRAAQFKEALCQRDIKVLSSDSFALDRSNPTHAVRVCLGTPTRLARVKEGLGIIKETLQRNE